MTLEVELDKPFSIPLTELKRDGRKGLEAKVTLGVKETGQSYAGKIGFCPMLDYLGEGSRSVILSAFPNTTIIDVYEKMPSTFTVENLLGDYLPDRSVLTRVIIPYSIENILERDRKKFHILTARKILVITAELLEIQDLSVTEKGLEVVPVYMNLGFDESQSRLSRLYNPGDLYINPKGKKSLAFPEELWRLAEQGQSNSPLLVGFPLDKIGDARLCFSSILPEYAAMEQQH